VTIRIPLQAHAGVPADVLGRDLPASQAGQRIFERGLDYAAHGHVTGLEASDATATVVGTCPYEVSIELDATALTFDCSCRWGRSRNSASTWWR